MRAAGAQAGVFFPRLQGLERIAQGLTLFFNGVAGFAVNEIGVVADHQAVQDVSDNLVKQVTELGAKEQVPADGLDRPRRAANHLLRVRVRVHYAVAYCLVVHVKNCAHNGADFSFLACQMRHQIDNAAVQVVSFRVCLERAKKAKFACAAALRGVHQRTGIQTVCGQGVATALAV